MAADRPQGARAERGRAGEGLPAHVAFDYTSGHSREGPVRFLGTREVGYRPMPAKATMRSLPRAARGRRAAGPTPAASSSTLRPAFRPDRP